MAKTTYTTQKRPVEQYEHKGKQRVNNPPVGLVDAESEAAEGRKTAKYLDEEAIQVCYGTVSLPFKPGKHSRVGVKIVDDRGIESLKIIPVK
jgi:adenine-specific DNA-methyltransferase